MSRRKCWSPQAEVKGGGDRGRRVRGVTAAQINEDTANFFLRGRQKDNDFWRDCECQTWLFCPDCNNRQNAFVEEGYWRCSCCGALLREKACVVFSQMEKSQMEKNEFLKKKGEAVPLIVEDEEES